MSLSASSTPSRIAVDRAFGAGLLGSVLIHAAVISALGTVGFGVARAPIEVHLVEFMPPRAETPRVKPPEPRKAIAVPEAIKPEQAAAAPAEPPPSLPQRTESRVSVATVTLGLPERVIASPAQRLATEEPEPPSLQIPRAARAAPHIVQAPSPTRPDRPLEQLPPATVLALPDVGPFLGQVERRAEPLPPAPAPPPVVAALPAPPPSSSSRQPQVATPAPPAQATAGGSQLHAAIPPATRDGGALTAPRLTRQKKPRYPEAARQAGAEGTVLVKAYVRADGMVNEAEVKRSTGNPALDRAALDTIRDSRFVPAERGGKPVAVWVEVPVDFRLER